MDSAIKKVNINYKKPFNNAVTSENKGYNSNVELFSEKDYNVDPAWNMFGIKSMDDIVKCKNMDFFRSLNKDQIIKITNYLVDTEQALEILFDNNSDNLSKKELVELICMFTKDGELLINDNSSPFAAEIKSWIYKIDKIDFFKSMSSEDMNDVESLIINSNLSLTIFDEENLDKLSKAEAQELFGLFTNNGELLVDGKDSNFKAQIDNFKDLLKYYSDTNCKIKPSQRRQAVEFALTQKGVRYNGGNNTDYLPGGLAINDNPSGEYRDPNRGEPMLSCNGLVYWAYRIAGIIIPYSSVGQMSGIYEGKQDGDDFGNEYIERFGLEDGESHNIVTSHGKVSDMTPGDIICYDYEGKVNRPDIDYSNMGSGYTTHHIAIYIGNGQCMEGTPPKARVRDIHDGEYSYSVTW